MARFYEVVPENRAQLGLGSALYYKTADMSKYAILIPLETVPAFASSSETIEIDVTTAPYNSKLEGKTTLEDKEVDFFVHRDSIRRLNAIKGQVVSLLRINSDFTGEKATGTVSFTQQDATSGDPAKGTIKVVLNTYDGIIDNVYDLLMPTVKFTSAIDAVVNVADNATATIDVTTDPADATVTVASETTAVATVAYASGTVTITGVAAGSSVITITAAKTDYASWTTTVLAIVE